MGGLEEPSEERDCSCLPHALLVALALGAAPQRQGSGPSHVYVLLLFVCRHIADGRTVEEGDLTTQRVGSQSAQ